MRGARLPVPESTPADLVEVPPAAPLKRSRLAFAMAVTVAALPILVVDNLPATASPERSEAVEVVAPRRIDASPSTTSVDLAVLVEAADPAPTAEATPTTEAAAPPTTIATLRNPAPPVTAPPVAPAPAPTTTVPPAPAPEPAPAVAAAPAGGAANPADPAVWDRLAQCEASGNWAANTGNGYYGGLQFSLATWHDYGGTGYPHQAPKATQIAIGQKLQAQRGWSAWPGCARKLGLHG